MAVEKQLTLICNPGSSSRKYALYSGTKMRASLHFEHEHDRVICTVTTRENTQTFPTDLTDITDSISLLLPLLSERRILKNTAHISAIGLRVVAPTSYFLNNRLVDDDCIARLQAIQPRAPLHIAATLQQAKALRTHLPNIPIIGVSDSGFHITKPDYAWNYGLPLADADRLDIKRFGYHGLSAASVVHSLKQAGKLPRKLIICHIGSGVSITAVGNGKSRDTTMGYSPLDGVVMATRSGGIDPAAIAALKNLLGFDDTQMEQYLHTKSGLKGLSGRSSDVRDLLQYEAEGDHHASLALQTYVYHIQKAIGQMTATLGGVDMLVFTGTVGERSSILRERILAPLHYLDFMVDVLDNNQTTSANTPTCVSRLAHSKPVFVVPAQEEDEMARQVIAFTHKEAV